MQKTLSLALFALIFGLNQAQVCDLIESGPTRSTKDGDIIENLYILASPTDDTALKITHDNVTVKNVVIHHAANARGIYYWKAPGLRIENVEVIAYGVHGTTDENNWGPQPCPARAPFNGYNCANIIGWHGDGISFENVYVEGGSKGISIQKSEYASMKNVIAKNVRGPFPAGQCFQIASQSDHSTLEDFYCLNEQGKHWTEDTVSAWRSANVTMTNGVVDGGNGMTGMGIMYEGSSHESIGGLVEDVEVRNAQGCFSGYPMNGLTMKNTTCGPQYCDGTPERGQKTYKNNWTFGNNYVEEVWSQNNVVEDSHYTPLCEEGHRAYWMANEETEYPVATLDIQEISLDDYVPKVPITLTFDWTGCMAVPDISCTDFPLQEINDSIEQTNQNTGEPIYVLSEGICQPNVGNDCHPDEDQEWCDNYKETHKVDETTENPGKDYKSSWNSGSREQFMSDCVAGGLHKNVCSAKYNMLNLKDKHEEAKHIHIELIDQIKSRLASIKGLKGAEYKKGRATIQPLRQEKAKALQNKNKILAKFKQSVEEFKRVKASSESSLAQKNTASMSLVQTNNGNKKTIQNIKNLYDMMDKEL